AGRPRLSGPRSQISLVVGDRGGGQGKEGQGGQPGSQAELAGQKADGGRAQQEAAVAEPRGQGDPGRPGQQAGPGYGGREQVGEPESGSREPGQGQPHVRGQRGDEHSAARGQAAQHQDPGAAQVLQEGRAGQPARRLGEREGRVARRGQARADPEVL